MINVFFMDHGHISVVENLSRYPSVRCWVDEMISAFAGGYRSFTGLHGLQALLS